MFEFLVRLAARLSAPPSASVAWDHVPHGLMGQSLQYDVAYLDRLTQPGRRCAQA